MRILHSQLEDPRRRLLIRSLAAGLFAAGCGRKALADILGQVPVAMPPNKSIYEFSGTTMVNGKTATDETLIKADDVVETGPNGHVIFAVGSDAFILRENSRVKLSGAKTTVHGINLESGALLSVFGKGEHLLKTPVASVGIHGTGMYAEAAPDLSYICTCYGVTTVSALDSLNETETVTSTHHSARYVLSSGEQRIQPAPFKNHTDLELTLLEALVGRVPPFALFEDDYYGTPKRY